MALYVENPKNFIKDLLELTRKFRKLAGYTIKIQNLVVFLYTKYALFRKERKKAIPFTVASETVKCFGINLTMEVKDLCTKTCKTLSACWCGSVDLVLACEPQGPRFDP